MGCFIKRSDKDVFVGMSSRDNLDVVETPAYNDEVKELLEYFYGKYYSVIFVIEGEKHYIKHHYNEPIQELLKEWEDDITWKPDDRDEYNNNLERLRNLLT